MQRSEKIPLRYFLYIGIALVLWTGWLIAVNDFSYQEARQEIRLAEIEQISIRERATAEKELTAFLMDAESVVRIMAVDQDNANVFGTGFKMGEMFFTANHVIFSHHNIRVVVGDKEVGANVLGAVQTRDLGVLRLPGHVSAYPLLFPSSAKNLFVSLSQRKSLQFSDVLVGMRCMPFGVPMVVLGELVRYNRSEDRLIFLIQEDPRTTAGCSGAPVMTYYHEVIGIFQSQAGLEGSARDIDDVLEVGNIFQHNKPRP